MSEIVVEVPDVGGDGQAAAVAAGGALVTAEQATEVAGEAAAVAEQAAETAEVAVDVAASAADTAYDAKADVAELRQSFTAFLDEWKASRVPPEVEVVEEVAPAPAPKPKPAAKPKPVDDDDQGDAKPAESSRGYGSKSWFGGR